MKSENRSKKNVAIVVDFLVEYGGAEKVLETVLEIWPNADIYTTDFWPEKFPEKYKTYNIKTGFISKLPFHKRLFNQYKLFHPIYFESLKLNGYDLVLSITSGFAKGVLVHPTTSYVSYINTPPRFLWGLESTRHARLNLFYKLVLLPIEHFWRIWDFNASRRPHLIAGNSKTIQKRIKDIYKLDSEVVYPPVELLTQRQKDTKRKYFFVVSRFVKYKRIDLIINAFKKLPYDLYISGTGEEEETLKKLAAGYKNIHFLGRTTDEERNTYINNAYATIFAGAEDFGIVMVESLSAGTPVIAYKKDGAEEIVEDGKTGVLFNEQSSNAIIKAVKEAFQIKFQSEALIKSAQRFSKENFKKALLNLVDKELENKSKYFPENIHKS